MKANKKRYLTAAIAAAPVLTVIALLLQYISLFLEWEAGRGYYADSTPWRTALCWFVAIAIGSFFLVAILLRREIAPPAYTGSLTVLFSSAFMMVCAAVFACYALLSIPHISGMSATFAVLAAIAAFVSVLYFALFLHPSSPMNLRRGMLGLAPAFLALFAGMLLYFDSTAQINQPTKLLSLFAYLLVAVFALGECRGLFGRQVPALQYGVTATAMLVSAVASLPNILYTLVTGQELVLATVYDFLLFAFSLYLLARLLQMLPFELPLTHRMVRSFLQKEEEELLAETSEATEDPTENEGPEEAEPEQISFADESEENDKTES